MMLKFSERSIRDTVLLTDNGLPLYQVITSTFGFQTKINKADASSRSTIPIANLERGFFGTTVTLWGKPVALTRDNFFSTSRTFTASDGCSYKWKEGASPMTLVTVGPNRATRRVVATFHRGALGILSKPRPMAVDVADEYLHLLDDIVTTCIYAKQERQRRRNQPT